MLFNILEYDAKNKLTSEDKKAIEVFHEHFEEFPLDTGGLSERYEAAKQFQDKYFKGTPYKIVVEEYCCNCTCTVICKEV